MGPAVKQWENSDMLDTGRGACCCNRQHSEPGTVLDNFKWEIPVYTKWALWPQY